MNRARRNAWVLCTLLLALGVLVYVQVGERELRSLRSALLTAKETLGMKVNAEDLRPSFSEQDTLPHLAIALEHVARGFHRPTDLAFVEGEKPSMLVLEQNGKVSRVELRTGTRVEWFKVEVEDSANEQGLLGIALHPGFASNGRFFVNYTRAVKDEVFSFVSEYRAAAPGSPFASKPEHIQQILKLRQPFANHNGGALTFGPDGMLYIGFGDGGSAGDPLNHGQNRKSWLGSILRIDIEGQAAPLHYRIPADNPFVAQPEYAPEIFALGVRNPWRMSFDPKGRLVVADVGQDKWEEVGYALAGDNLGWAIMEGKACFRSAQCEARGMRLPFLVYGREQGISITGGYVVTSEHAGALRGLYVYADYGSGRIWAAALPEPGAEATQIFSAGAWPINPSTFGRDGRGDVYVADHAGGHIYRLRARP